MAKDSQLYAMAEAVMRLFDKGNIDPKAEEIAHEYYGDIVIGRGEVDLVRRKLTQIKRVLDDEFSQDLYLVSEFYYRSTRARKGGAGRQVPNLISDAQKCLPLGTGVRSEGIHLLTDPNDSIWLATRRHQALSTAGGVKNLLGEIFRAQDRGLVSEATSSQVLRELDERSLPEELEHQGHLAKLRALPSPDNKAETG